jgi:PITH domain
LWVRIIIIYRECIATEEEIVVDLTNAININGVYALNEKVSGSSREIFKAKEFMLEKDKFLESNDEDPELLIYIPFTSVVKVKNMILIGGEDGTSPSHIKLFVNCENPDFNLIENGNATQEFDCIENANGLLYYGLRPSKFNNVQSITIIVDRNHGADNTKIYYIGFTGIKTNKKKMVLLGNYELKPVNDPNKVMDRIKVNNDTIYG